MSGSKLYYIYIDTKIVGAIEQLVGYFQAHIFHKDDCISVVCKYYKEIDVIFAKIFEANSIPYIYIRKQSELKLEKSKTVFYLFNAQSNCKLVANRDLVHIFVTHGESHKLASIKPIIKIYDYIITSGEVGIERYLKAGIFTPHDVNNGKLIPLGNTFLGSNDFIYDANSEALIYAPTWEGGIPEENYCSININNAYRILDFCKLTAINTLYIKPHPNIGHRDISYKNGLRTAIEIFQGGGLKVIVNKKKLILKWHDFFQKNTKEIKHIGIEVKYAITDISAMEMQFVSKKIPCVVLINEKFVSKLLIPRALNEYYSTVFLTDADKIQFNPKLEYNRDNLLNYFLSYPSPEIENASFRDRVLWLCSYTRKHLDQQREKLMENY